MKEFNRWLEQGIMKEELLSLDNKEIEECFYKELSFGTGGIRAIMIQGQINEYIYN